MIMRPSRVMMMIMMVIMMMLVTRTESKTNPASSQCYYQPYYKQLTCNCDENRRGDEWNASNDISMQSRVFRKEPTFAHGFSSCSSSITKEKYKQQKWEPSCFSKNPNFFCLTFKLYLPPWYKLFKSSVSQKFTCHLSKIEMNFIHKISIENLCLNINRIIKKFIFWAFEEEILK